LVKESGDACIFFGLHHSFPHSIGFLPLSQLCSRFRTIAHVEEPPVSRQ
jgi:hypothetical protein